MNFTFYDFDNYKLNTKETRTEYADTQDLEKSIKILSRNKCYHELTQEEDTIKLFGDLDFSEQKPDNVITDYGEIVIRELNKKYELGLTIDDFKYTTNNGKLCKKTKKPLSSYHWSVPVVCMKKGEQKNLMNYIHNTNSGEFGNIGVDVVSAKKDVDMAIYSGERLFRLPNQKKENKEGTQHKIVNGTIRDFILYDIENAKKCEYAEVVEERKNDKKKKVDIQSITQKYSTESVGKMEIIKLFIEKCYSVSRCDNYDEWINMGIALKNSFEEHNAIELFDLFSKRSAKYGGRADIEKVLQSVRQRDKSQQLSTGSLFYWAKEDNINEYKNIIKKDKFIDLGYLMTNKKIANLVFEYAKNKFFWKKYKGDDKKESWVLYYFNGARWIADAKVNFKNYMAKDLKNILEDLYVRPFLNSNGKQWSNEEEEEAKNLALYNMKKLLQLENNSFLEETYKISHEENECIDVEFDNNPYLLGFKNGVWDLKSGTFRPYQYDDFITFSTGWDLDYDPITQKVKVDEKKLQEVEAVLKSIHPEEEERNFYLSILASTLDGIAYNKFFMFVGNGRNGKGLINDYLMYLLGNDYSTNLNQNVLGNKTKTGANPEVAKISRKRFISCQEPEKGTVLNLGFIKELTGGAEKIDARFCNSNDTATHLNGTLIYQCNEKPSFGDQECGDAEYERFEILEFKQTFSEDAGRIGKLNAYNNKIQPMNKKLASTEWREAHRNEFFYILSNAYNQFRDSDYTFKSTAASKEATKSYLATSKVALSWFYQNFEYKENTKESFIKNGNKYRYVKLETIYSEYFKTSELYENMDRHRRAKFGEQKFVESFKQEEAYKAQTSIRIKKEGNPIKLRNVMWGYDVKEILDEETSEIPDVDFFDNENDDIESNNSEEEDGEYI